MRKKSVILLLTAAAAISLMACGNKTTTEKEKDNTNAKVEKTGKYDTLVIGEDAFNGIFSPFFYLTEPDKDVYMQVFSNICELNDKNELLPAAGELSMEELKGEDGKTAQTKYTIKLKDGLTFSDGKPVTIDDVIFNYYVYCDPTYDGMSTINTAVNIVGLKDYYYDSPDYTASMKKIEEESKKISEKEVKEFIEKYTDKDIKEYGEKSVNSAFGLNLDEKSATFKKDVRAAYLKLNMKDKDNLKLEAEAEKLSELKEKYIKGNLEDGIDVKEIEGIQKVDNLTCTILVDGVSITAERQLTDIPIAPKHYYGVGADGTEFSKGNLSMVKEKNGAPMGGGPFIYEKYDKNIVTLKANPNFYKGAPKFPKLRFQVVTENNKVDSVNLGEVDITNPGAQKEVMKQIEKEGLGYSLIDNNGYGYISISAKRVPDINVRKGLMHLISRGPAISSYFGDLAKVIERPMTTTLAEYPVDAKEYYGYDPAKAEEYFKKAGYSKNSAGKLVGKDGKQLSIECAVGDLSTHPSSGIMTQMKTDLDKLGAQFIVSDLDFNVLSDRITNDDVDMYVLAWSGANDCDLTQLYHSSQTAPGASNRVWLQDKKLDSLLEQTLQTLDLEKRKKLVAEELDIVMDWAVTMPIYQRENLFVYNPEVLNLDTIPANSTAYYNYKHVLHEIELN